MTVSALAAAQAEAVVADAGLKVVCHVGVKVEHFLRLVLPSVLLLGRW